MGRPGTSGGKAKLISERGAFVVGELFKLRRLTREQLRRLVVDRSKGGERFLVMRLGALGLVSRETTLVSRKITSLVRLTELGHKRAADAYGRHHPQSYRDEVVFFAHLLRTVDLYLEVVAEGAKDWTEVRERASRFEWFSSNEQTQFRYRTLSEFAGAKAIYRQVVPDVTIETETWRFLVEIEKSTKSQKVVGQKVEQYGYLFSPLKTAGDRPAYEQKYGDTKTPVLLFVFDSEARAENARVHFEKYAGLQNFPLPEWRCGTAASVGEYLREALLGRKARPKTAQQVVLSRESLDVLREFAMQCTDAIRAVQKAVKNNEMPASPRLPDCRDAVRDILYPSTTAV